MPKLSHNQQEKYVIKNDTKLKNEVDGQHINGVHIKLFVVVDNELG